MRMNEKVEANNDRNILTIFPLFIQEEDHSITVDYSSSVKVLRIKIKGLKGQDRALKLNKANEKKPYIFIITKNGEGYKCSVEYNSELQNFNISIDEIMYENLPFKVVKGIESTLYARIKLNEVEILDGLM